MAKIVLTDLQQVPATVSFQDAAGNPASVDGVPEWVSSDPTILSVAVSPDGLSATIVAIGKTGSAQVSVSADADLGSGTQTITGTLDVDVQPSQAVQANISPGTPV